MAQALLSEGKAQMALPYLDETRKTITEFGRWQAEDNLFRSYGKYYAATVIAHVRVLGVDEVNGPFDRTTFSQEPAVLRIEILELYRGETVLLDSLGQQ